MSGGEERGLLGISYTWRICVCLSICASHADSVRSPAGGTFAIPYYFCIPHTVRACLSISSLLLVLSLSMIHDSLMSPRHMGVCCGTSSIKG